MKCLIIKYSLANIRFILLFTLLVFLEHRAHLPFAEIFKDIGGAMGNCAGKLRRRSNADNAQEYEKSRMIDKQIKTDEKKMKTEVKLLLLGKCLVLYLGRFLA